MVDGSPERGSFRSMPHVSLAFCDRAPVPISQTTHGTQLQSFAQSGERSAMDVDLCLGLLAIATDAGSSQSKSSGLVSQQGGSILPAHSFPGATFGVGIFVGVGYTRCDSQTCWKRHWQTQELSPGSAYSLSSDLQEQKSPKITCRQPVIGICFSFVNVQFDCTSFVFYSATLNSS